MKNILWTFWLFLAALSGLWLMADSLWPAPPSYFALRGPWVQYSGVLAIGTMSLAMLLAVRPVWLEQRLNGLDKMYRLHKWLGIAALMFAMIHWLWAQGTKWAVSWGWLARPERTGGASGQVPGAIEAALRQQRGLAESLGDWAFYATAALLVLALMRRFPYRWFVQTHKLLAVAYLVLAFHTAVLTEFRYWSQPVGWVLIALLVAGSVAAVLVLLHRVGASRTIYGTIESLQRYPALYVLETTLLLDEGWHGHKPGQFAFGTSNPREGAHPYTIASAWNAEDRRMTFITKALGDHTSALPIRLHVGDRVKIEGPYGCFTFDDDRPRQIWIGGGIGLTPFIARMKHLAQSDERGTRPIDLFYTTAVHDSVAIDKLHADAAAADVRLHVFIDGKDGLLSGAHLRALVPEWEKASIWFCGPTGFARALRADLMAQGLPATAFHQELFEMR